MVYKKTESSNPPCIGTCLSVCDIISRIVSSKVVVKSVFNAVTAL